MVSEDTGDYSLEQSDFVRTFPYIYGGCDAIFSKAHGTGCRVRSWSAVAAKQATKPGRCKLMVYLLKYIQGARSTYMCSAIQIGIAW